MRHENSQNIRTHDLDNWFWNLRPLAHRFFQLPGVHRLRPLAAAIAAVATPAGEISYRVAPTRSFARDSQNITILSANLYHDWPRHRHLGRRLEALVQLVEAEAADILLLQEVARTPTLRCDEWLARRLGMAYIYARANGHERAIGFEEGVAIYSRFPLTKPVLAELGRSQNPFVRRLGLGADVLLPAGQLSVFSVHLGVMPRQNAHQMSELLHWVDGIAVEKPAVIGGDFNAHETTQQIRQLGDRWFDPFRHLHPHADGTTHELRWPWGKSRRRLDYHFLHGKRSCWSVLEAGHLSTIGMPHSDHQAVLTRLQMRC